MLPVTRQINVTERKTLGIEFWLDVDLWEKRKKTGTELFGLFWEVKSPFRENGAGMGAK